MQNQKSARSALNDCSRRWRIKSLCVFQEVLCACNILTKEASRMSVSLGELRAVPLCPGYSGMCPPITESPQTSRRVFVSCSQSEDLFWPVDTIAFVIDTGVEKRLVSVLKTCFYLPFKSKLFLNIFQQCKNNYVEVL